MYKKLAISILITGTLVGCRETDNSSTSADKRASQSAVEYSQKQKADTTQKGSPAQNQPSPVQSIGPNQTVDMNTIPPVEQDQQTLASAAEPSQTPDNNTIDSPNSPNKTEDHVSASNSVDNIIGFDQADPSSSHSTSDHNTLSTPVTSASKTSLADNPSVVIKATMV